MSLSHIDAFCVSALCRGPPSSWAEFCDCTILYGARGELGVGSVHRVDAFGLTCTALVPLHSWCGFTMSSLISTGR